VNNVSHTNCINNYAYNGGVILHQKEGETKVKKYDLRSSVGIQFSFIAENDQDAKTRLSTIYDHISDIEGVRYADNDPTEIAYEIGNAMVKTISEDDA
jgi:hypothetical protein